MGFLEVMNSKPLYIMVMIGLGYVFLMCVFMMQRAWKHCLSLGMTKSQLMDIVKSSTIYTIILSVCCHRPVLPVHRFGRSVVLVPSVGHRFGELRIGRCRYGRHRRRV